MSEPSRRQFLTGTAGTILSAILWPKLGRGQNQSERDIPRNVVFWMTGRLRADALGCYGHPVAKTPNLDRLASQGVLFANYRTVVPDLSPSRASLMTGLYPHMHRVLGNGIPLDPSVATLGELIRRDTKMVTGYIGNWALGQDKTRDGFVHRAIDVLPSDAPPNEECEYSIYLQDNGLPRSDSSRSPVTEAHCQASECPQEHFVTTFLANRALEFIDANRKSPFFLVVSDPNPSNPYRPPVDRHEPFDPAEIPVPESAFEDLAQKPRYQAECLLHQNARSLSKPEDIQDLWACYLSIVSLIDEHVGRVTGALDHLGIAEDTLFVFTSDHGDLLGSHRMVGSGPLFYEELIRVPLVIRWPRRWKPARVEMNVASVDLMPTFLDTLGLQVPESIHGRSAFPLIEGNAGEPSNVSFGEWSQQDGGKYRMRMILKGRRKYILNLDDDDEFYDLEADPPEMLNLLNDPRRAPDAEPLRKELLAWMKESGDPLAQEVLE